MEKIADNYDCANQLESFKQLFLDPVKKRVDNALIYMGTGDFVGLTKAKKIRVSKSYEDIRHTWKHYQELYDSVLLLIERHEGVIHELSRIYVGMRDKILAEGKFPSEMLDIQAEVMQEYYESIEKILKSLKL